MKLRILIADDEPAARFGMRKALAREGHDILEATDGVEALERICDSDPDLVFLDLSMPRKDGVSVLRDLRTRRDEGRRASGHEGIDDAACDIVVVTADDSIARAVECMQLGATDYMTKPFEVDELRAAVHRAHGRASLRRGIASLRSQLDERRAFGALIGESSAMRHLFEQMERVARAPLDVLIRGETGTGKELIAREIHRASDRADGPFEAVNTAAIPDALVEGELFGHVRGAYTGADADRAGFFERAHGGTLFLDEVGDMPTAAQAKMLRVLQDRRVQRLGATKSIDIDVRVISATHQDLRQAMDEGWFREDLYFRIRGVELRVPPLRERKGDVLLLAEYFLEKFAERMGCEPPRLAVDAADRLLAHGWSGNVRELEHVVAAAAAMRTGELIHDRDLEIEAARSGREKAAASSDAQTLERYLELPLTAGKQQLVEDYERLAITRALETNDGNVSAAARQLGVHRQSLQKKMGQLGVDARPQ